MLSHQKAQAINRYVKHRRYSIAFIDLVISLFCALVILLHI